MSGAESDLHGRDLKEEAFKVATLDDHSQKPERERIMPFTKVREHGGGESLLERKISFLNPIVVVLTAKY